MTKKNITPMTRNQADNLLMWFLSLECTMEYKSVSHGFVDISKVLTSKNNNPLMCVSLHIFKGNIDAIMFTYLSGQYTTIFDFNDMQKFAYVG